MNAQGPRILVVDDSATSRIVIEKQLAKLGCRVTGAENGGTALAALEADKYDLVLLDCYMPDMNGYEVARRVRAREEQQDNGYTPLIGISAEADAAHIQLCLDSGMDGILGKPLPMEEFKKMLVLWCDYEVDKLVVAPVTDSRPVDLESLFISTSLQDLQNMRTACSNTDIEGVRRMAHRMKGAALTMGRDAIVNVLEKIEATASHHDEVSLSALSGLMNTLEAQLKN